MSGWTGARGRRTELGSAGLAVLAYGLAVAARREYPFGPAAVAGAESVPYHAHLGDLLHGTTTGDWLFNWNSGYGAPFLPDFAAYLANPCSWPVAALLPRDQPALAGFLVPLLSLGLAAALMTRFLGRLHPGPGWQRALLGAGYGLCAWAVQDGAATPAWLWGTVSLPLLCLAGDWCLRGRHRLVGILAVTAAWAGNLPTGVAATVGAGSVLLLRLLLTDRPVRARLGALWRAGSAALLGALLAAPVLTVGLKAARAAQPGPLTGYQGTPGPAAYLGQLLPGGQPGLPLPDVAVGVLGLLLAATLPFNRRVGVRERIGWPVLLLVTGAGLVWRPEVVLWHDPGLTGGSPYRGAFVLAGLLVMAAWVSLSRLPDPAALAGGAALLALVVTVAQLWGGGLTGASWLLVAAGGPVVAGGLWLLGRDGGRRAVATGLTLTVLAGTAYAAFASAPATGPGVDAAQAREAARTLRADRDWPTGRADPGPHAFTDNDPLLLDGQGGGYRSGQLPRVTAELLHDLGAGWRLGGRQTLSPADPVGRAVFGVRTYLTDRTGGGDGFLVGHAAAAPLVTVRTGVPVVDRSSVWTRQGSALGVRGLYEVPALTPVEGPAPTLHGSSGWSVPATPAGGAGTGFELHCSPGSTAYFHGPWYAGTVEALGGSSVSAGQQPTVSEPVRPLGTVPADGKVALRLRAPAAAQIPAAPVGCLAPGALDRALAGLTPAERVTAGGHTLTATLPAGSLGTAVIAAPAVDGWTCRVNAGPARVPGSLLGLIAVPLGDGATTVACEYRPPGLTDGLAISAAALAVLCAVALLALARRRPQKQTR
ncbi:YfhO family protein [Kitasatospora sp. NPDC096147]|uniref:YfhO family protein n=1 Tax=Kitasatospora sp. NPDC096147 TaxID=3364093 RepID=UPI00380C51D7